MLVAVEVADRGDLVEARERGGLLDGAANSPSPLPRRIAAVAGLVADDRSALPSPVRSGLDTTTSYVDQPVEAATRPARHLSVPAVGRMKPALSEVRRTSRSGVPGADDVGGAVAAGPVGLVAGGELADLRDLGVEVAARAGGLAGVAVAVDRLERLGADLLAACRWRRCRAATASRRRAGRRRRASPRWAGRSRSCRSRTSRRSSRCSRACARRRRGGRRRRTGPPRSGRSGRPGSCSRCRSSPCSACGTRRSTG